MAFLDILANPNPATRQAIPFLLEVQADLLAALATRVVVPLYRKEAVPGARMVRLTPEVDFQGQSLVAMFPELAGVARRSLGPRMGDLAARRAEMIGALDLLLTGI